MGLLANLEHIAHDSALLGAPMTPELVKSLSLSPNGRFSLQARSRSLQDLAGILMDAKRCCPHMRAMDPPSLVEVTPTVVR